MIHGRLRHMAMNLNREPPQKWLVDINPFPHDVHQSVPHCGWTKSYTTWKPWETIVRWYLQGNHPFRNPHPALTTDWPLPAYEPRLRDGSIGGSPKSSASRKGHSKAGTESWFRQQAVFLPAPPNYVRFRMSKILSLFQPAVAGGCRY